jgi:hypothetical protein
MRSKICLLILAAALLAAGPLGAEPARMPDDVTAGLEHLLDLADPGRSADFQPKRVEAVMRFVDAAKPKGATYESGPLLKASSSYLEVDVRRSLSDLLQYAFNPSIPWFTTTPSSLRLTDWKKTEKPWSDFPRLWELWDDAAPVVVRGVETVENTPDLFSGGYYRYDLDRGIVLFKSGGRRTLISVSRQRGPSEVGKKGYILGKDEDWTYFYSGEPGLTATGLGWVKSYMFDSAGISVYTETAPGAAQVRTANFKWLRAGWSGMNVVRAEHIHQGLARFAKAFKEIIESPRLPAVKSLEEVCLRIEGLSAEALREKIGSYRALLAKRGELLSGGARKHLPESFWDEGYWSRLSREEMESMLVLETFKGLIGKAAEPETLRLQAARP